MSSKEDIKVELVNYKPTDEEKLVIRSALFNVITLGKCLQGKILDVLTCFYLATVGAASLGMSARLWGKKE